MRLHRIGLIVALMVVLLPCIPAVAKITRSRAQVESFLRQHEFKRTPPGYEVDHIIPLCAEGKDSPENMQLLTVEEHKRKTKGDLQWCRSLKRLRGRVWMLLR